MLDGKVAAGDCGDDNVYVAVLIVNKLINIVLFGTRYEFHPNSVEAVVAIIVCCDEVFNI